MNETARKPKITMPCIVNSAGKNPNPLLIIWLTEVTFISDDILISVLNTCQTYAVLTEWRNYVLRNIDRVTKISKIDKNDLNEFCEELKNLIADELIRPTASLNCKTLDVNLIGYGDGDDIAVNKDPKNNLLINFGKFVQFNPKEEEYKKKGVIFREMAI